MSVLSTDRERRECRPPRRISQGTSHSFSLRTLLMKVLMPRTWRRVWKMSRRRWSVLPSWRVWRIRLVPAQGSGRPVAIRCGTLRRGVTISGGSISVQLERPVRPHLWTLHLRCCNSVTRHQRGRALMMEHLQHVRRICVPSRPITTARIASWTQSSLACGVLMKHSKPDADGDPCRLLPSGVDSLHISPLTGRMLGGRL